VALGGKEQLECLVHVGLYEQAESGKRSRLSLISDKDTIGLRLTRDSKICLQESITCRRAVRGGSRRFSNGRQRGTRFLLLWSLGTCFWVVGARLSPCFSDLEFVVSNQHLSIYSVLLS
jgi:hypothetical protein